MIIRSQDGLTCVPFELGQVHVSKRSGGKEIHWRNLVIGIYDSEKESKLVIDMICNAYLNCEYNNFVEDSQAEFYSPVFQMPQNLEGVIV